MYFINRHTNTKGKLLKITDAIKYLPSSTLELKGNISLNAEKKKSDSRDFLSVLTTTELIGGKRGRKRKANILS